MRYRTLGYTALLGLLLLLFAVEVSASGLQASLDRTQVAEGETVMLTLSAPADVSGTPDLSPLQQDFDLLGQSQSTHTRIINGQGSSSREWRINLAPKRSGKLSVPALHWGSLSSQAQGLEVLPAGKAAQLGMARPALLEIEAKPEHPYVQSKVVYTVRLLYRKALQQASLSEPQADNAIIERLGEDKRYNTERNGQPYQVIERRYAIFPQASGKLEIKPPVLSAQILDTGRQRSSTRHHVFGGDPFADMDSFFGNNGFPDMGVFSAQTRPVELRGRSIALKVKPQPAGAMSPWLPAESLSLNEAWSPDPPQFHVGEPVTRTIAITAQGLSASQLPDLELPVAPGIKAYPDKPQTETHASGDTLVAQKIFKLALVPSQAGSYTLPAIHLKWWDIAAGKVKTAQLAAREIRVLPAVGGTASPSQPSPGLAQTPAGGTTRLQPASSVPVATGGSGALPSASGKRPQSGTVTGYWPWVSAFFALAWLLSSALWLRARKANGVHTPPAGAPVEPPPADAAKSRKRLEQACRNNDARAARQALIEWAAAQWPALAPGRLEVVAQRLGPDAREIVQQLDRGLYAQGRLDWDGVAAWSRLAPTLDKARQGRREVHRETALPPLYPQRV